MSLTPVSVLITETAFMGPLFAKDPLCNITKFNIRRPSIFVMQCVSSKKSRHHIEDANQK